MVINASSADLELFYQEVEEEIMGTSGADNTGSPRKKCLSDGTCGRAICYASPARAPPSDYEVVTNIRGSVVVIDSRRRKLDVDIRAAIKVMLDAKSIE